MGRGVPRPLVRRSISITTLFVGAVLWPILFPLGLLIGFLADLVRRDRRRRCFRAVLLIGLLVLAEVWGFLTVLAIWAIAPLGFRTDRPRTQNRLRWIMQAWARSLMWAIRVGVPLDIDVDELDESLLGGNAIVIGRHRSLLDAIIPAVVFGRRGLYVRYSLKEDLRWEPNIDLVGHLMPHRFVTRSPKNLEAELEPLRALASGIDENTVGVIFPEGTFFTEARKQRVIERLAKHDPLHVAAAEAMQHVLPPRPAGTLALLDGAPAADVIVLGHVGFERFGSIPEILRNLGGDNRIELRAWRIPRDDIPTDSSERIEWLFDIWSMLDRWIAGRLDAETGLDAQR